MIENRGKKSKYLGGKHESQRDIVLRIIVEKAGATMQDLQQTMKIKNYIIRGRVSELKTSGMIYLDAATGRYRIA